NRKASFRQNSLYFSLLAGNRVGDRFDQNCHHHHAVICYWRFPERVTKGPELAGICATVRSSETTLLPGGGCFWAVFFWPRNSVSRKRRPREAETRFECGLRRRKSEHLVLARPLGGHVGEAGHSHAMRQPSRDGRCHEIGRQEGKRDRDVDLPNAAPL